MSDQIKLADDEKATPAMAYTATSLCWGSVITKQNLSPGRALTGITVPDFLALYNAQTMLTQGNYLSRPIKQSEMHVPTLSILAYHLMPPHEEPPDYDESEPNRHWQPLNVFLGPFRMDAKVWVSDQTDTKTYIGISKADYLPIFDVTILNTQNSNMKPLQINQVLVRRLNVIITVQ